MSIKVQPMDEYVVAVAEEAQTKTASGLYLPGGATEKPKVAQVVAVGKAVGEVKVGDRILYKNEYEATNVKVDGDAYIIVYARNIIATVK
ncbi:MAG TPA: co-chaperone GroES family protein [Candidatus Saccharimonadales bacterium]